MQKNLVFLFLLAHFFGDFYFQSNSLANRKNKSFIQLLKHRFIYLVSMTLFLLPVFGLFMVKWVLLASFLHFLIDLSFFYLKRNDQLKNKKTFSIYSIDQLIHLSSLFILVHIMTRNSVAIEFTKAFDLFLNDFLSLNFQFVLSWLLAITIVIKPVSITISKLLVQYQPSTVSDEERGHPGAGSLIGILERLIILVMLSQNQYGAIAFILTAKSIARYNKIAENPQFSEYYLLGTLLSILLVVITDLFIF